MRLNEDIVFGNDQLNAIIRTFQNSSIKNISFQKRGDDEIVNNVLRKVGIDIHKSASIYAFLRAASYGSDTNKNPFLRYFLSLDKKIIQNTAESVDTVLQLMTKKQIELRNPIPEYLLNASLYNRNQTDVKYAATAFDAVLYKKNRFFDVDSNNLTLVNVEDKSILDKFYGNNYAPGRESDTYYYHGVIEAVVEVDQKYFFTDRKVSKDGKIIPSDAGGKSPDNARTMWNIIDLWSTGDSNTNVENNENEKNLKQQVKDIIGKKNLSDSDVDAINNMIDRL